MRAVVLAGPRRISEREVTAPTSGSGTDEVVLDVRTAAICSTDRKAYATGRPAPRVLGHEFAGTLPDGTHVGVHPEVGCGSCASCVRGLENRCPDRRSIGLGRDGGFAGQVAVPRDRLLTLGAGFDPDLGPLLEPLACCVHAVGLLAPQPGEHALVVGAGAIGILSMWVLQAAGCTVTVSQRSVPRRDLARALGADAAVAPDHVFGPRGRPTLALVSVPGTEPLGYATEQVEPGGRVHVMAGSPGGAAIDANHVHYRHLTMVGSTGSTFRDYERGYRLVVEGAVPLGQLPVAHIPLAGIPAALEAGTAPGTLKTLIDVRATDRNRP